MVIMMLNVGENFMKNWIIVLLIFIIPLGLYGFLDNTKGCRINTVEDENPHVKVIKFSSPMCSECVKVSGELKKSLGNFGDSVVLEEIDVMKSNSRGKIKEYKVSLVPTIIFLDKKGNVVRRQEGYMTSSEITEVLDGIEK